MNVKKRSPLLLIAAGMLLILLLISGCTSMELNAKKSPPSLPPVEQAGENWPSQGQAFITTEAMLSFYGFTEAFSGYESGYYQSGDYSIYYQLFTPAEYTRTVFMVHGYLTHSSLMAEFIEYLYKQGFRVAAIDLPGHGFSSGSRATVANFTEYAEVISDGYNALCQQAPGSETLFIGHSTGCSGAIELIKQKRSPFTQHIFMGPLVRSFMYNASRFGSWLLPFMSSVPRAAGGNFEQKYDKLFLNDPCYTQAVPMSWVRAMFRWNDSLEQWQEQGGRLDDSIVVLQGTKDRVVDYKYNMRFLEDTGEQVDIRYIENAEHDVFWCSPDKYAETLALLEILLNQ